MCLDYLNSYRSIRSIRLWRALLTGDRSDGQIVQGLSSGGTILSKNVLPSLSWTTVPQLIFNYRYWWPTEAAYCCYIFFWCELSNYLDERTKHVHCSSFGKHPEELCDEVIKRYSCRPVYRLLFKRSWIGRHKRPWMVLSLASPLTFSAG